MASRCRCRRVGHLRILTQCGLLICGWLSPLFAQVEVQRFFPPAVSSGSQLVQADGKFTNWPLKVVCDRQDIKVLCGEKPGELRVEVPSDVAPGVAWLRLCDDRSASALTPLLIDAVPVVAESEPNDQRASATAIRLPASLVGKLEKNGDVDMWRVDMLSGQRLTASVTANALLKSPMDAVLQLVDSTGTVLAQAEDNIQLDPLLVYQCTQDGPLWIRLFAFPETPNSTIGFAGGANFIYRIQVTSTAFLDHSLPLLPSEDLSARTAWGWNLDAAAPLKMIAKTDYSPATVYSPSAMNWHWLMNANGIEPTIVSVSDSLPGDQVLVPPVCISGHIVEPGSIDRFRLAVKAGVTYVATVKSRELGFTLDSVVRILQAETGAEVARNDDAARGNPDASVDFKLDKEGEVIVELSDLAESGSLRHAYALVIQSATPTFRCTVGEDHQAVVAGQSTEVKVSVNRLRGFDQSLKIFPEGLPEGVSAEPTVSQPKGDTAKSVTIKLSATAMAKPFQGPWRLMAVPLDSQQASQGEAQPCRFSLRPAIEADALWLSVVGTPAR